MQIRKSKLSVWLREPLVHFLLIGAGLFLLFHVFSRDQAKTGGKIVVTSGKIQSLAENWARTWQRPPTKQELEGLVRDYIKDEIFYREAMAMGLDQDDTVIRRRLRQKMEIFSQDIAAQTQPTDQELEAYLKTNPEKFRVQTTFSFSHVFLSPDRHQGTVQKDAEQILEKLNKAGANADVSGFGDPFLLSTKFDGAAEDEISRTFGEKFAANLASLQPGKWQGPIESGYGLHLVYIRERTEGTLPALKEVRNSVEREWLAERRKKMDEQFYQSLLQRYNVTVEAPKKSTENVATAESQR